MLRIDRSRNTLYDDQGRRFDTPTRQWLADDGWGEAISLSDAVRWLQRDSGRPLQVPVGVIGPRAATDPQIAAAEAVGRGLAAMGLHAICGGRQGVMEAVSRGVSAVGGVIVGLVPEPDPSLANPYLTVAIATGIGEARNALIARAALCLVAVGNSLGTLSEVALGLHFGKLVLGLEGAAQVEGVRHLKDAEAALDQVARAVLSLSPD